jgi:ParB family transcriptional regulator, chromosome partitioning protein
MLKEIKLSQIVVKDQPRKSFDEMRMTRLINSIKVRGLKVPLDVEETDKTGEYLLVDGERRYRALKEMGKTTVPVMISPQVNALDHLVNQFHIQEQHENWTPIEKAVAVNDLAEELGKSTKEIGSLLGVAPEEVARYVAFSSLINKEKFEKSNFNLDWAVSIRRPLPFR